MMIMKRLLLSQFAELQMHGRYVSNFKYILDSFSSSIPDIPTIPTIKDDDDIAKPISFPLRIMLKSYINVHITLRVL